MLIVGPDPDDLPLGQQQQTFHVHLSLLESHSPVLAAMFKGVCVKVCVNKSVYVVFVRVCLCPTSA